MQNIFIVTVLAPSVRAGSNTVGHHRCEHGWLAC